MYTSTFRVVAQQEHLHYKTAKMTVQHSFEFGPGFSKERLAELEKLVEAEMGDHFPYGYSLEELHLLDDEGNETLDVFEDAFQRFGID